ncbi:hypothetical protein [Amycolatopsis pigmentata]|uniref:MaoC like domain-containing protein n=1 Tax=Amycolatopsis pigmentata TaxID=450801 RepID=A0ABW5G7I8_9PSEU
MSIPRSAIGTTPPLTMTVERGRLQLFAKSIGETEPCYQSDQKQAETDRSQSGWQVGDRLEPLALPPISRTTLALFAGGSGDHNALHIDVDAARAAGLEMSSRRAC